MPLFRSRKDRVPAGSNWTPAQVVEWGALVARFSEVVSCCDCRSCQRAEALAAARRLRVLADDATSLRPTG